MSLVSGVGEAGEAKRQRNVRISYFLTLILKMMNLFLELWTLELAKDERAEKPLDEATQAALVFVMKSTERHIMPLFPFQAEKKGDSVIGMALFDLNLEGASLLSTLIHLLGWSSFRTPAKVAAKKTKEAEKQVRRIFGVFIPFYFNFPII